MNGKEEPLFQMKGKCNLHRSIRNGVLLAITVKGVMVWDAINGKISKRDERTHLHLPLNSSVRDRNVTEAEDALWISLSNCLTASNNRNRSQKVLYRLF